MHDGIETTRTTVEDGVRVRKTIDAETDGPGTVTLEIDVERDDPVAVRMTEPALDAVPREAVELHADHGAEHWRADEAAFEREFAAGESYTAVYRVRDIDADRFEALDADPAIELSALRADAGAGTDAGFEGVVSRTCSDAVRELVAGERDSLAAGDGVTSRGGAGLSLEGAGRGADGSDGDDPSPGASAADGSSASEGTASGADRPEADGLEGSLSATPSGGVARALLGELRAGDVDEEVAEALRSELQGGRSQELRIRHLQNQVSDLAAYAEMLEAFVDERGTVDAAFEAMETEVATLDDEVEAVRSDLDGLEAAVGDDVDALEAEIDGLRDGQDDLEGSIERLEERLETVDDRLDEFDEFKERLSGAFQGLNAPEE